MRIPFVSPNHIFTIQSVVAMVITYNLGLERSKLFCLNSFINRTIERLISWLAERLCYKTNKQIDVT